VELPGYVICSLAKVLWKLWCGEKDSVTVRCNVSVIYGPGVISGERLCHLSDLYGSELWVSLVRVSHGQAIVLLSTFLNTVLRHCLLAESRRFVITSTITSTLTQSVSYFIIFPSWQPISLSPTEMSLRLHRLFPNHQLKCPSIFTANFSITNWNVLLSSPPISQSPTEMSLHLHRQFPYHQLKCPSVFTANFPITNWNVLPSLQPISLSPIEMSFHLYNLFPNHQLHCPSIFTPNFPITN
jgi:hypothetical protein